MRHFQNMRFPRPLPLALLLLALCAGCKHDRAGASEIAYVSAPQALLRDRISAVYNKVGVIENGERVVVLAHDRRFVKVRSDKGLEGWIEQRYLVDGSVYNQLEELGKKYANAPAQAHATVRNDVNMHVTPARDSEKLFQLKENEKVELIQRAVTGKNAVTKITPPPKPRVAVPDKTRKSKSEAKLAASKPNTNATPETPAAANVKAAPATQPAADPGPLEDWWLVRDTRHRVGWVLGRMVDIDVPMEVAQYAEGKRVVAAFVLATVSDPESDKPNHQVPYYLMLTNEPHDGQAHDFDGLRVFTWNTKKHHYETAYRERDLNGVLPVVIGREDFGKDGVLPTFTVRVADDNGAMRDKKYRLEGVLVKRVYAPGEQPEQRVQRKKQNEGQLSGRHRSRKHGR